MDLRILKIILLHVGICVASHHSHTIPVEGYETELQDLGEHVEIPETPVRIIKITKTVAVKIPVPYPVKVVEKVPYPVHVNKPYPVPVPQIVHVPHTPKSHEHVDNGHGYQANADNGHIFQGNADNAHAFQGNADNAHAFQGNADDSYQVNENHEHQDSPNFNAPANNGYAQISEDYAEEPPSDYTQHNNYYGSNGLETNAAIQQYPFNSHNVDANSYY